MNMPAELSGSLRDHQDALQEQKRACFETLAKDRLFDRLFTKEGAPTLMRWYADDPGFSPQQDLRLTEAIATGDKLEMGNILHEKLEAVASYYVEQNQVEVDDIVDEMAEEAGWENI